MSRRRTLGAFAGTCALTLGALIGVSQLAHADDRAEQLAAQANTMMFSDPPQYEKAIDLYQQAIVLSPEGKYYFNLCVAYYSIGEFGLALQSCDAVSQAGSDAKLNDKTGKLTKQVEDQIRAMGKDPEVLRGHTGGGDGSGTGDGTGTDAGTGDGTGTGGGGGGQGSGSNLGSGQPVDTNQFRGAKPASLFTATPATHDYVWSLGGELYGLGGSFGNNGTYAGGGAGFRLHGDYIVSKARKLGVQGFIAFDSIAEGNGAFPDSLSVVDLGVAAYAHIFCTGALCVTPLAGVQLAGYEPASQADTSQVRFMALGVRGEVAVSYAFGAGYEHVISLTPGLDFYLPTFGNYDGLGPEYFDLDGSNRSIYIGLGYTHRFNTPFGQAPFITLE